MLHHPPNLRLRPPVSPTPRTPRTVQGGQQHQSAPLLFWDTLCRLPALQALSSRHCDMRGSNLSQGVLTVSSLRSLELSSYLVGD